MAMCIHSQEFETCRFGCTLRKKEDLRLENDKLQAENINLQGDVAQLEVYLNDERGENGRLNERYIEAVNDMAKLKRKLKNCICPHCGFGFEQALKKGGG